MNETEQAMAAEVYAAIQTYTTGDDRSLQSQQYQVGVSDLGWCSERTRRMLAQEDPDDTDMTAAFIGTAIGDHAERALKQVWPDAIIQPEVVLRLDDGTHTYDIPGHPDVVRPSGLLLDVKTTRGLSVVARTGFTERQKRFQRHGYAKACHDAGMFECDLDQVQVGNIWIDRAADDKEPLVRLEPYDQTVIYEMTDWLTEVIYAFTHDQEAPKEPPREVCAKTCGFFTTCRMFDTDVAGLITAENYVAAMQQYREGLELTRLGDKMKDQAKAELRDVDGFAMLDGERWSLRWTTINETVIPETIRRGYSRMDFKKAK